VAVSHPPIDGFAPTDDGATTFAFQIGTY
jgi:hypothetical protein